MTQWTLFSKKKSRRARCNIILDISYCPQVGLLFQHVYRDEFGWDMRSSLIHRSKISQHRIPVIRRRRGCVQTFAPFISLPIAMSGFYICSVAENTLRSCVLIGPVPHPDNSSDTNPLQCRLSVHRQTSSQTDVVHLSKHTNESLGLILRGESNNTADVAALPY